MASDWIKMRTDLYRDPKVCVMADLLMSDDGELARYVSQNMQRDITVTRNVMRNVTVGALVSVWGVLRHRGKRVEGDLLVKACTLSVIDDVADLPGFGAAMESVGWAVETEDGIVFPRFFDEFNVDPEDDAKKKNAERQRRYRENKKQENNDKRDVTVTSESNVREEKRREVNNKKKNASQLPDDFALNETSLAYADGRGVNVKSEFDAFRNYHEAKGSTYKDWQAAWRTWCDNSVKFGRTSVPKPDDTPKLDTSLESRRAGLQAQADESYQTRQWLDGERKYRTIITIENGQIVRTKHYDDRGIAA